MLLFVEIKYGNRELFNQVLLERIELLCKEKKLPFAKLERELGISNGQLRRWGHTTPKITNLKMVADYFGVSIDYLIGSTTVLGTLADSVDYDSFSIERVERAEKIRDYMVQVNNISDERFPKVDEFLELTSLCSDERLEQILDYTSSTFAKLSFCTFSRISKQIIFPEKSGNASFGAV